MMLELTDIYISAHSQLWILLSIMAPICFGFFLLMIYECVSLTKVCSCVLVSPKVDHVILVDGLW